ncbi:MAG: metallophosphoesterase [Marinobacterium sp.]|nr:metallophosphoesterase [Marinobacterium sp.]
MQGYDLIGDIHGCASTLKLLLEKLGYRCIDGVYQHPLQRQVVFLGDIVDRGPRIREAVQIVYSMVKAGQAKIVMGNHEYNLLCYMTRAEYGEHPFLRERTPRHYRILKETLEQYENYPRELDALLAWIMEMPLYLEFDHFRVVHACWAEQLIEQLEDSYGVQHLTADMLQRSARHGTFEWTLLDRLLRGTHLRLPNNEEMISRDGFRRRFFRTKFWARQPQFYADVVFQPDPLPSHIARRALSVQDHDDLLYYGEEEKPLFIGHYWREGRPEPITDNIACLDYSAVKFGKLVAYRMDNESVLSADKFVWVDVHQEFRAQVAG